MLSITIPNNNLPERKYIIKTLLEDYLGITYEVQASNSCQHYSISFNNVILEFKDRFFSQYPEQNSYLVSGAIPEKVSFVKNDFIVETDIPVIFGNGEIEVNRDRISYGMDIFASAFFMLTRWEEYVNKTRDEHQRFPHFDSIAHKNGFLHRPVVNEYVEMLWAMLKNLGFNGERKHRSFELILTHDIDQLDYPKTYYILLGDILKRRSLRKGRDNFSHYLKSGKNPYDTFDFIMQTSEKLGLSSHFYFMSSDLGKAPDNDFYIGGKRFREKVQDIKARGHVIGFHPGYYTCNDFDRWNHEKQILEDAIQDSIVEGRQHYLRFEIPTTFNIWDKSNMKIDSTMGYAKHEGFRCGTGDSFPVFDFLERKELELKERPLIVMDGNLQHYSLEDARIKIMEIISFGRKYKSTITLLFHNTTFYGEQWEGYADLYTSVLSPAF